MTDERREHVCRFVCVCVCVCVRAWVRARARIHACACVFSKLLGDEPT